MYRMIRINYNRDMERSGTKPSGSVEDLTLESYTMLVSVLSSVPAWDRARVLLIME